MLQSLKKLGYVDAAHGGHIVIQGLFDQFSTVTGAGMTIGLVVFMTFMAKSTQLKSIGKLALVPGIFNINEPVLFGLPIVMNPMLAIPFFIMPPLSAGSTYLLIKAGILPYLNGVQVPMDHTTSCFWILDRWLESYHLASYDFGSFILCISSIRT